MSMKIDPKKAIDTPAYVPPLEIILRGLGLQKSDFEREDVIVSSRFLKFLISKLALFSAFDPVWYASAYPDVEAARLAGDIGSLKEHFISAGYFEGRLPSEPSFDPKWYRNHYKDIGDIFSDQDVEGLRNHFFSKGYYEGRIGARELNKAISEWLEAGS
jgi:hypothetical protein